MLERFSPVEPEGFWMPAFGTGHDDVSDCRLGDGDDQPTPPPDAFPGVPVEPNKPPPGAFPGVPVQQPDPPQGEPLPPSVPWPPDGPAPA